MPFLPQKELSQAHYDRVVAAFPGTTAAQKAASYDAWLTNALIAFVKASETARIDAEISIVRQQKIDALGAALPSPVPFPPV